MSVGDQTNEIIAIWFCISFLRKKNIFIIVNIINEKNEINYNDYMEAGIGNINKTKKENS